MVPQIRPGSDTSFFKRAGEVLSGLNPAHTARGRSLIDRIRHRISSFRSLLGDQSFGLVSRKIILVGVFALSFLLPLSIAVNSSGFFSWHFSSDENSDDKMFNSSVAFSGPLSHVKIAPTSDLLGSPDKDLLLISWVKFRRIPENNQRMTIFSSLENTPYPKAGFALAVSGEGRGVRPAIYWSSQEYAGWYRFSEFSIDLDSWYLFAISFRHGNSLGLHLAQVKEVGRSEISLLGGYDLSAVGAPIAPNSSLFIAPPGDNKFYGRVGGFGVLSISDLTDKLKDLLKNISRDPSKTFNEFDSDDILLRWEGGENDLSSFSRKVTIDLKARAKKVNDVSRAQE